MILDTLFNSREEALLLWIVVVLIFILSKAGARKLVFQLLESFKIFLDKKILLIFILMLVYVCMELFILSRIDLMNRVLIKDVIIWLFGSAFIVLININKVNSNKDYLRKMIVDSFKLVIVVEFIINFYTFNFFIEIMLIPLIFFLMAMSTIAGLEKRFSLVKKIVNSILTIIGIVIFAYAFTGLINNYSDLATLDNLRAFTLSPILTILYIPFIYFLALFAAYEVLFVRLDSLLHHNKSLIALVKKKIILSFHIKLKKLNQFSGNCAKEFLKVQNEKDVNDFFASLN